MKPWIILVYTIFLLPIIITILWLVFYIFFYKKNKIHTSGTCLEDNICKVMNKQNPNICHGQLFKSLDDCENHIINTKGSCLKNDICLIRDKNNCENNNWFSNLKECQKQKNKILNASIGVCYSNIDKQCHPDVHYTECDGEWFDDLQSCLDSHKK